jgi:phage anti-repressor protein
LLSRAGNQTTHTKGGQNKEIFMLTIDTLKKFCVKAGTKKADEIHDYFILYSI